MYPWPSFGNFFFKKSETELWGSDVGWVLSPSYAQMRPVGAVKDYVLATSIGSASREFECHLELDRFIELQSMINTVAVFTDWERPIPDSRLAMLMNVEPAERLFHQKLDGFTKPAIRVKVSLLSQ